MSSPRGSSQGLACHIHTSINSYPEMPMGLTQNHPSSPSPGERVEEPFGSCVCGQSKPQRSYLHRSYGPSLQKSSQEKRHTLQSVSHFFSQQALKLLRSCRQRRKAQGSQQGNGNPHRPCHCLLAQKPLKAYHNIVIAFAVVWNRSLQWNWWWLKEAMAPWGHQHKISSPDRTL